MHAACDEAEKVYTVDWCCRPTANNKSEEAHIDAHIGSMEREGERECREEAQ